MNPKSIPELSVDAQTLAKLLEAMQPGEVIPYATLTQAINRDVQDAANGLLNTARNIVLRDKGYVMEAVRGEGIKRLMDDEIPAVGTAAVRRINRCATRASRKVMCADYDKLDAEGKRTFNTSLSLLGALKLATTSHAVKRLESAVATKQMPSADVLNLFAK